MNTLSAGVNSIAVARGAGRPYLTAAEAAARLLELPVQHADTPDVSAISIGPAGFVKDCAGAAALIAGAPADKRWELIYQTDEGGWLVTGATEFAAAHALLSLADWLRWAEPLPQPCRILRTPVFHSMTMEFDDWSAGFARLADGFVVVSHHGSDGVVESALSAGVPTVLVGRPFNPALDVSHCDLDNLLGGRLAARHLIEQG